MPQSQVLLKPVLPVINSGSNFAKLLTHDFLFSEGSGRPIDTVKKFLLTKVGSPTWGNTPYGAAGVFPGSGQNGYSFTHNNDSILQKTSFQVILHINSFPGIGQAYLANLLGDDDDTSAVSAIWRIGSQGDSALAKRIGINFRPDAVTDTDTQNNNDLSTATWYDIVVVTDGTNITWYINGKLDTQSAYNITPQSNTLDFYIGHQNAGASYRPFDGKIALMRLWNGRALTHTEVRSLYVNPWQLYSKKSFLEFYNSNPTAVAATYSTLTMLGVG